MDGRRRRWLGVGIVLPLVFGCTALEKQSLPSQPVIPESAPQAAAPTVTAGSNTPAVEESALAPPAPPPIVNNEPASAPLALASAATPTPPAGDATEEQPYVLDCKLRVQRGKGVNDKGEPTSAQPDKIGLDKSAGEPTEPAPPARVALEPPAAEEAPAPGNPPAKTATPEPKAGAAEPESAPTGPALPAGAPTIAASETKAPAILPADLPLEPPPAPASESSRPVRPEETGPPAADPPPRSPAQEIVAEKPKSSENTSLAEQVPSAPANIAAASNTPAVRPPLPLQLHRLSFCNQVLGFGEIEPMDERELRAGQHLLVYVEVRNFVSAEAAGMQETRLASTITVESSGGALHSTIRFPDIVDRCATRRRDFFAHYTFALPTGLAPGNYVLRLRVKDLQSGTEGEKTIEFTVAAPESAS